MGEVTGVCTTVLGNIENLVPMTLVNILGGVIGTVVFTIMILIFDWRIGLIAAAGIIVYLLVVSSMEKNLLSLRLTRKNLKRLLLKLFWNMCREWALSSLLT